MDRRITVLHLIESLGRGGAEQALLNVLRHLNRRKIKSIVAVLYHAENDLEQEIRQLGLPCYDLEAHSPWDPKALFRLMGILRKQEVDLVHTQLFGANVLGRIGSSLLRIPVVTTLQFPDYEKKFYAGNSLSWKIRFRQIVDGFSLRLNRQAFIAVSQHTKESSMRHLGFSEKKVHVIPNTLCLEKWGCSHPDSLEEKRRELGIEQGDKVLTCVGRFVPQKGQRVLLQAMPKILKSSPRTRLLLLGSGPQEKELQHLSSTLGLSMSHVSFLGVRSDVKEILEITDLFLFPSVAEGLSLALLEAMATGRSCLACNIPPTRKMIEDGKTGFLVSGWDPSVWANRTVELLGNPLLRKNTGDEARRFVCETFDASRWAREIETLFEALVPLRRRRSFSSRFVKSVYFPFIQILKREKGRGVLKRMEENQWLTREELEKSQWGALRQLLFHACGHVPYYREKFEKLGVHPKEIANDEMFRRIPLLSKEEVVEHHESFLSSCYPGRRWEGKTSGSTGISLRFHYDSSHESYVWASVWRGRRWWDVDVGDREVDLWGRPLGSKRLDFTWQVKSRLRNVLHFSSYVLDERRMGEYAEVIKHFRPALLYGYSSSIVQFGEFVACKGYCFPSLRLVECTADELLTSQKIRLEKIFNCPVVSAYGASEAGGIAQECLEGNLHISMEHMKIEFLQEGQPAPPHETSEIVVTTLRNFAMPLIRYRIGDVGTFLEKTCPCGRGLPLMELHIGKSSSIIQTSLTSAVSSKLFDYINVGLMREGLAGIRQFKVQQTGRDSFNLLIVKESAFSERSVQFFKDRMKEYLGNHIIIETSFVDKIRRDTTGKLRYFEQIVSEKVP